MFIQPIQPLFVVLKIGQDKYECQMISMSEDILELKSSDYFEKDSNVLFFAKHFRGHATIEEIEFAQFCFTYQMHIKQIQFQPGLLINTRL